MKPSIVSYLYHQLADKALKQSDKAALLAVLTNPLAAINVQDVGLEVINLITPALGVGVTRNVVYANAYDDVGSQDSTGQSSEQLALDVYYPPSLTQTLQQRSTDNPAYDEVALPDQSVSSTLSDQTTYPVIVFVYGGSWVNGQKSQYQFVGRSMAQADYITIVMDYRKAPQYRYPDYVTDTANAIGWVYHNLKRLRGNPKQLFVIGHSAGAFNAVAATSNVAFMQAAGVPQSAIAAVIGIAGPYSYDYRKYESREAFPEGSQPHQVMPNHLISGQKIPPYLLLTAAADSLVHSDNTRDMVAALQQANAAVTTDVIPKATHASSIIAISPILTVLNPVRRMILTYFNNHQ